MTVAVIGHRKINKTQDLVNKLTNIMVDIIENEGADTFLFGSRSQFDDLCYEIVTELKQTYTYIRRIEVRAEYEYIDQNYYNKCLEYFEDSFYPQTVHGAGKLSYVVRNNFLIDSADLLIAYCDKNYQPTKGTKSGAKLAFDYASKKRKRIINVFE